MALSAPLWIHVMTDTASLNPSSAQGPGVFVRSEDLTLPVVVYVLYLCAIPTAFLSLIVGVVIAYANRADASVAAHSHYEFQIRTFWLSLLWIPVGIAIMLVSIPLMFVLIGIPLFILAVLMLAGGKIWYVVRCIVGLIAASQGRPYPNPDALIV
jgi:uncharacterized membrane protein